MISLKEYILKEVKPNKYEYGYKIQKLDIELMINLGLNVPDKIKEIYKNGFNENELQEYIYFNDPVVVEFLKNQYYIRDYIEFCNMNEFELNMLIDSYKKRIQSLISQMNILKDRDLLNNLQTEINILTNEMLGVIYLKDNIIENTKKK